MAKEHRRFPTRERRVVGDPAHPYFSNLKDAKAYLIALLENEVQTSRRKAAIAAIKGITRNSFRECKDKREKEYGWNYVAVVEKGWSRSSSSGVWQWAIVQEFDDQGFPRYRVFRYSVCTSYNST